MTLVQISYLMDKVVSDVSSGARRTKEKNIEKKKELNYLGNHLQRHNYTEKKDCRKKNPFEKHDRKSG